LIFDSTNLKGLHMDKRAPPNLSRLFTPRSVAIFNVSSDPSKLSRITLRNLKSGGFKGAVFPLNPTLEQAEGFQCIRTLAEADEPIDVAFMAIPAGATISAARECGAAGVKFLVIGSAGFAESGAEGAALQRELAHIAQLNGMRIVGPNCNGIYQTRHHLALGFNTGHSRQMPVGHVALLSHSGALFDTMTTILRRHGGGLSFFVSAGNEADLNLLDYLEYAVNDPNTHVVAMLLDALSDGNRFRRLIHQANRLGKSVVVLKIGSSQDGAEAAEAHCSRLASPDAAYRALFAQSGVCTVNSIESLMTAAALLSRFGRVGGGLGALTVSGAGAAILLDSASRNRVPMTTYAAHTQAELDARRMFSRVGNPTDYGAFGAMRSVFSEVPALIAGDPGVTVLLSLVHSMNDYQRRPYIEALANAKSAGKPILVLTPGGLDPEERAAYEAEGFVCLADTDAAMQAVRALTQPATSSDDLESAPRPDLNPARATNTGDASAPRAMLCRGRPLSEPESLELLSLFAIPTVRTIRCANRDDAARALQLLGGSVVMKGVRLGVTHKTEHGLVKVGIQQATEIDRAVSDFGIFDELIVQPMIDADLEVILGLKRSDDLGLLLIVGLGGVYAEALSEVVVFNVPASAAHIADELSRSPVGRVMNCERWPRPGDFQTLLEVIDRLQNFAMWAVDDVEAVDINPLRIGSQGIVAVDALVVPRQVHAATEPDQ
jgi:acetyltransferase